MNRRGFFKLVGAGAAVAAAAPVLARGGFSAAPAIRLPNVVPDEWTREIIRRGDLESSPWMVRYEKRIHDEMYDFTTLFYEKPTALRLRLTDTVARAAFDRAIKGRFV